MRSQMYACISAITLGAACSYAATVLEGKSAFSDYRVQKPGVMHKITPADLPKPHATESVDNGPHLIPRPQGAWPQALPGFKVELYAEGLKNPRLIRRAPNGDFFVAESDADTIRVFRGIGKDGKAVSSSDFATGLREPFGIAFYPPGPNPQYVYVGNTGSIVRFPYHNGDTKASGPAQTIVPNIPSGGRLRGGGHWTRDIAFSLDGKKCSFPWVPLRTWTTPMKTRPNFIAPIFSNSIPMEAV